MLKEFGMRFLERFVHRGSPHETESGVIKQTGKTSQLGLICSISFRQ